MVSPGCVEVYLLIRGSYALVLVCYTNHMEPQQSTSTSAQQEYLQEIHLK